MKVAVVEFAGKGGLIHYAFQLCRAMHRQGADVTLVTSEPYELGTLRADFAVLPALRLWDAKAPSPAQRGTRNVRRAARAARYYREWLRLEGIIRKLSPDVVQMGDIRFATDAIALRRLRGVAPVLADICHNIRPFAGGQDSAGTFGLSAMERVFYRRAYQTFDAIFVHYAVNVTEFSKTFPESRHKVVPIVHGNEEIFRELSDSSLSAHLLREDLAIHAHQPVVLFFGTLAAYKGLDLLLAAFATVARAIPESVLVLAGHPLGDFSARRYVAEAESLGLAGRLRIVDRYIDSRAVAAWMSMADVVVFPYRSVYQSGALHVAHTFGAPIVATRVGAMPEVISDRRSGLLVDPDDQDALAGALIEVLKDRQLAASLGKEAANDAAKRFSWDSVSEKILRTYDRLLAEATA